MCAEEREPPAVSASAWPCTSNLNFRAAVTGALYGPVSITAAWPAEARDAGDDPRRPPLAGRVDALGTGRDGDAGARGHDAAVAHDHGAALNGFGAIAARARATDDRESLGVGPPSDEGAGQSAHH